MASHKGGFSLFLHGNFNEGKPLFVAPGEGRAGGGVELVEFWSLRYYFSLNGGI